jgi:hypothetical protein
VTVAMQIHSNHRKLSIDEYLLILIAGTFPESVVEPKEVTKLRREAESSYQVAKEVPGSILDSLPYEYLKKVKKLYD